MLLADGKLVASDGAYRPTGDLADIAVPETLTELVAARLDALEARRPGPPARCRRSRPDLHASLALAAVSGIDEPALEPRLRSLARRELLAVEGNPRSPERGQYAFVQSLVREVAYNTLAKRDRKVRHLAAARYFESLGTDELAGRPCRPLPRRPPERARGPEADTLAAQARVALRAAAERAIALGSHAQAVAFLEEALSVTTDLRDQALLRERCRSFGFPRGRPRGGGALSRARPSTSTAGSVIAPRLARTTAELGAALIHGNRYGRALAILEPAATEFADLAGDPEAVALDSQLARALFRRPAASARGRGRRSCPGRGRAGRPRGARGRHAGHPRFRPVLSPSLLRRRWRNPDGDRPCRDERIGGDHLERPEQPQWVPDRLGRPGSVRRRSDCAHASAARRGDRAGYAFTLVNATQAAIGHGRLGLGAR